MTLAVNIAQGGSNNVTFRNKLINGNMVIDQRNAGAAQNALGSGYTYLVDRWAYYGSAGGKFNSQQNAGSITPPAGFVNYLGLTVASAVTVTTSDQYILKQSIEGYNIADLNWGLSTAKPVTLSFWVYSSLTGTFSVALKSSGNRSYVTTYTISSANTWTQINLTVAGDTSTTWLSTNGVGINIWWNLGAGSTYTTSSSNSWQSADYQNITGSVQVVGTSGATFYITGVQLEAGTTASPFEYRQYGTELALCQRYALKYNTDGLSYTYIGNGLASLTNTVNVSLPLPVQMRTAPSVTSSTLMVQDGVTITSVTSVAVVTNQTNSLNAYVQASVASGLTQYRPYQLQTNASTSGYLLLSAEL